MKKKMRARLTVLTLMIGAVFVVVVVIIVKNAGIVDADMVVYTKGGLCDPSGETCKSEEEIFSNSEVAGIIEDTDFYGLPANTNDCISALDGSDVVVRFPKKYGDVEFLPCEIKFPQELLSFLTKNGYRGYALEGM